MIRLCIVTEFEQKDFFQWRIALESNSEVVLDSVVVNSAVLNQYPSNHSFWSTIKKADVVFVYCVRHNIGWKWYELPTIVKKFMNPKAKMICQFDLEFLWLWYPNHFPWKEIDQWSDGKTPEQFFAETKVLEVADAYIVFFNSHLKKLISKPVYEIPLPQLVRYEAFLNRVKKPFKDRNGNVVILKHSVKSASYEHTLSNVIRKLKLPVTIFTCEHTDSTQKKEMFKKLQNGSRVYGRVSRGGYVDLLEKGFIAIDDNEGYYGWSRFAMECALTHVPCIGSTLAVKEFFPELYTKHKDYKTQRKLIKELCNDRKFWIKMAKTGKRNALRKLNTNYLANKFVEVIKVEKAKKIITRKETTPKTDVKKHVKEEPSNNAEWKEYQRYKKFVEKHRPKTISSRPVGNSKVYDQCTKDILTREMWDLIYGRWKRFIDGKMPEKMIESIVVEKVKEPPVEKPIIKKPKVAVRNLTIVVAVRNKGGARARNFCKSLANQTNKNFEVIMVDYGSNKIFQKELSELCREFDFEYHYVNKRQWSRARALNIGISVAHEEYVMTTDIDMIFRKNFIAKLQKKLSSDVFIWTVPTYLTMAASEFLEKLKLKNLNKLSKYMETKFLGPSRGAIQCAKKDWFIKVNGYDERMYGWGWEDTDMWKRASKDKLTMICLEPRNVNKLAICAHQWHSPSKARYDKEIHEHNAKFCADSIVKKGKGWILRPILKVLIVIDVYGWAFDFVARGIKKYGKHNYTIKRHIEVEESDARRYDVIFVFHWTCWRGKSESFKKAFDDSPIRKIVGVRGEKDTLFKHVIEKWRVGVVSKAIYDKLMKTKGVIREKVYLTHNGVDVEMFSPSKRPKNRFVVGWAGNPYATVKRYKLLENVRFPLLTQVNWGKEYFKEGRSREEMIEFYKKIDVFINVSSSEGMPQTLLEAAATGLPIIVTNVGGMPEFVGKKWVIPVEEDKCIRELNKKLFMLKQDSKLRLKVGQRNLRKVRKDWDMKKIVKEYDKMFEES